MPSRRRPSPVLDDNRVDEPPKDAGRAADVADALTLADEAEPRRPSPPPPVPVLAPSGCAGRQRPRKQSRCAAEPPREITTATVPDGQRRR